MPDTEKTRADIASEQTASAEHQQDETGRQKYRRRWDIRAAQGRTSTSWSRESFASIHVPKATVQPKRVVLLPQGDELPSTAKSARHFCHQFLVGKALAAMAIGTIAGHGRSCAPTRETSCYNFRDNSLKSLHHSFLGLLRGIIEKLERSLPEFLQTVFVCSPEIAASIDRRCVERQFPHQTIILKQGDTADATYLMATGRAHALIYGLQGQLALLREYLPGDFFGAIANSTPEPEEADVVAVEDVRAAVFQILDFLGLAETYSCVGLAVSKILLKQLRATSARVSERTTLSAAGRVYSELLRMANCGDGRTIVPAPVLANLAIRAHTTRESASRAINAIERRGIIFRDTSKLTIIARHRLEELVI